MMMVSLITALVIAFGKIAISLLSAFAIVYFRFPLRNVFFWAIFVTLMLPVEVRIGPTYEVVAGLGMLNTYAGLTVPLIASATATFLFRQFFLTVPDELVEAARIDGAGPMRFFWDVLVPLSATSIAALFVIQFIYGWNQYLWPLLVTTDEAMYPVVIGIKRMISGGDAATDWNIVMATAMLAMIPPALVVLLMQKWFVKGLVDTDRKKAGMAISIRKVVKRYGAGPKANAVIHGVDAEIADGEFIVIVGPSGCGKSTLLRMVAGLEEISGGEIAIAGRVVNDVEPSERDIAMVFQNYALYPHMTVREHGLRPEDRQGGARRDRGARGARRRASCSSNLPAAQAARTLRRPAPARGDGPRHRAPACCVPVRRAAVQPRRQAARADAAGDPEAACRAGVTSLFVTHDQVEAMTLAQRMIVMNAGRMEQIGTPAQVYATPATTFVAGFIGSPPMNLIRGGRGPALSWSTARLALPAAAPARRRADRRPAPEHAAAGSRRRPAGPSRSRPARCWAPSGWCTGAWAGRPSPARVDAADAPPNNGETLALQAVAGQLHWFDATTRSGASPIEMNPGPHPLWIAHRGAGKLAPENTLAPSASARRIGGYRAFGAT